MLKTLTPSSGNSQRTTSRASELFGSTKPMGFAGGDTNLRRYVGNSPTNYTDPSGLAPPYMGDLDGGNMVLAPPPRPVTSGSKGPPTDKWPMGTQGTFCALRRYYTTAPDRSNILDGIPILQPPSVPVLPGRVPNETMPYVGTGEAGTSKLGPGQYFGVDGAGVCAGCLLIPKPGFAERFPDESFPTIGFHFSPNHSPESTFLQMYPNFPWYAYEACINGSEIQRSDADSDNLSRQLLRDLIEGLRGRRIPIRGYVPGTGMYVDDRGRIHWPSSNDSSAGYFGR